MTANGSDSGKVGVKHEPLPVIGRGCSGCMYFCRWLCCGKVYCRECFAAHAPGVASEAEKAYRQFLERPEADRYGMTDEEFYDAFRGLLAR